MSPFTNMKFMFQGVLYWKQPACRRWQSGTGENFQQV